MTIEFSAQWRTMMYGSEYQILFQTKIEYNVDAQFLEGSKDNRIGYFMFGMTFHVVEDVNKLI